MKWEKYGCIFNIDEWSPWARTHASWPVVLHLSEDVYRVFFGSRDINNYSSIGYFDFDITNPKKILNISEYPILMPGEEGFFDDCGVVPSDVIKIGNTILMYYVGFSTCLQIPYRTYCGMAEIEDRYGNIWGGGREERN